MALKTVEQKFKKLSEVEHCLSRPGRYIGSIAIQDSIEFIPDATTKKMTKRQASYSPGFLKLFDEIITNSADHSRTPEGKHLDIVRVDVDQDAGTVSVYDNGGIPVVKHSEYNQWVPEMIFELRSGSNFNDDDHADLAGQNGEGAALTCIFSEFFTVETCDGKKKFKMTFTDNSQTRPEPKVSDADGHKGYTRITYKPELARVNMGRIDDDAVAMLYARTVEIAATNTHLKVYFNGERIMTRSFKDYVEMFDPTNEADIVFDDTEFFKVAVMQSEDGFQHTSFVSCTHTKTGGTHVTYVVNQIVDAVRDFIKKKYKVEVRPADVRNHLHLFIDCRIINPRYSSQTKDDLITEVSAWGSGRTWSVPDKFIQKLLKTQIIQSIMDWVEAKANAEAMKDLRKANKDQSKFDPRKVDKFSDAMEKKDRQKCVVYFAEGDCIDEATKVRVLTTEGFDDVMVKDIRPGDLVLTHHNNLKEVTNVAFSVKPSIVIRHSGVELVVSPEHRLAVYDPVSDSFGWIPASELTTKHKLIKSTVIDCVHAPVVSVVIEDGNVQLKIDLLNEVEEWTSTLEHKFYVFDMRSLKYALVEAKDLQVDVHLIAFRA